MAEEMSGTAAGGTNAGLREYATDNMSNRCGACEPGARRLQPHEDPPRYRSTTVVAEVAGQGFPNVSEQRQALQDLSLPTDHELCAPPVDIVKLKRDDLSRPQPKSREEEQDCVVATPTRR